MENKTKVYIFIDIIYLGKIPEVFNNDTINNTR